MSYAEPAWRHAARELKNAAELDPAWRWFARSAMMDAHLADRQCRGQEGSSVALFPQTGEGSLTAGSEAQDRIEDPAGALPLGIINEQT
jgi:hypothetical protein